ncbi:hypothetical protein L1887_08979 [Cichorium endivia]|nr:hypothetical protein L1887_08979 [Cichorium endivia]
MDWAFVNRNWEKWACNSVGSDGQPLKAALLINYDPTGPSCLLFTMFLKPWPTITRIQWVYAGKESLFGSLSRTFKKDFCC